MTIDAELATILHGNTTFAVNLYRQLSNIPGNLLFSPYSISVALAMTYAGARGETAKQIARVMHFAPEQAGLHSAFAALQDRLSAVQQAGQVQLGIANSIWPQVRYPLLPEFIALLHENYGVEITPLDYVHAHEEARLIINAWVEDQTDKKIVDLISEKTLDSLVRLVLVNAVYFKGNWAAQFDPADTVDAPFWVAPGESTIVPMMQQIAALRQGRFDGVQVLELPYAGGELSMLVLLPETLDGLDELQAALSVEQLHVWTQRLDTGEVKVLLPKFKTEFAVALNETLIAMGMPAAFDADAADFSGMDGFTGLYIGYVLHKAFIDVNEEGTEAAAATAVIMKARSLSLTPTFRADQPFIYLIRDNATGCILFMGRVTNPLT